MEVDMYFGDLDVKVELSSSNTGFVNILDDNDIKILFQIIYMALSCFNYIRAMYTKGRE